MAIAEGGRWSPQERIVSPGVFTRENDLSFLPQGIANIGGAIIAPFPKGPAYSPTLIDNQTDLETFFGVADGVYYGPYSAKEYLKNQGQITVVRVAPLGGYLQKAPIVLYATSTSTDRLIESSSISSAKLVNCTIEASGSVWGDQYTSSISDGTGSAGFIVSASVQGILDSGSNAGTTYTFGTVAFKINLGDFNYISGSDGTWFESASLSSVEISNFALASTQSIYLTGTDGTPASASLAANFTLTRTPWPTNPNRATCTLSSAGIYGKYGELDYANRTVGSEKKVLAILANTAFDSAQNLYGFSSSVLTAKSTGVTDMFALELNTQYIDVEGNPQSSSYGTYNFSVDPTNQSFLTNVFSSDARSGQVAVPSGFKQDVAYVYKIFNDTLADVWGEMQASGSWQIEIDASDSTVFDEDLEEFVASYAMKFNDGVPGGGGGVNNTAWSAYDIKSANTPWITSQLVSPWQGATSGSAPASQSFDLFRFHTLSHGTNMNTSYKIEISNVKLAGTVPGSDYGSFDVGVRAYNDTDDKPQYLELFTNCSLDPDSVNFVARKIGDSYSRINFSGKVLEFGDYGNKSRFVRLEMTEAPYPKSSVPYGFQAFATPIGGSEHAADCPAMTYTNASIYSSQRGRYASGVQFNPAPVGADAELSSYYAKGTQVGPEQDNKQYNAPLPVGAVTTPNSKFDLDVNCSVVGVADLSPVYNAATESDNVRMRKFVLGFQGGFDGQSPSKPILVGDNMTATNQQGLDCSTLTASGSVGYKLAINALGNADEYDINLIWTPGIIYNYHTNVVRNAVNMCEARGDCFYVFDIYQNQTAGGRSVQNVVDKAAEFNTNYAATYYPWIKIIDTTTNKLVKVPPSVVMPSVYAQSDRAAAEWFAPAGLNRGGIEIAKQVMDKLTHSERDTLYEGRVNPIVAFPGQGISVWGQKTLQVRPSALDRINVRRLLINLKKFIASSSKFLVFEQNVSVTRNRFLSIVNPYLESVQQRSGLYAFRVVMDENNNTPDVIDRNILYGQIYLQPTKTAEFILLDFNVLPSGASFDGI